MASGESIRIQPAGGLWETLGVDRLRGIWPENIVARSDQWGPSQMDFTLKAEAGARRPDLLPFTPIDLEVSGELCWSGFVWQRPTDANNYSVSCRGWQFHLDEDLYQRAYVHTRLADYVDLRSLLQTPLGASSTITAGQVANDGILTIGTPNGTTVANGSRVGVTLDLGPDSSAIRIVLTASTSFNSSTVGRLYVVGHDSESWHLDTIGSTRDDYISNQGLSSSPWTAADQQQTFAASNARAHRYITVVMFWNGAATLAGDVWLRIHSLQAFLTGAYESGNASALRADQVVTDALTFAPLLNMSTAGIGTGSFTLPSFTVPNYQTPRAVMEAVNAVENYQLKIGGEDLRSLIYKAKPTSAIAEVGDWAGSEFSDATVSGEPIYNKAIVDGSGPGSARVVSKRGNAAVLGSTLLWQTTGQTNVTNTGPIQLALFSQTASGKLPGDQIRQGVPYAVILNGGTYNLSGATPNFRIRIGGNATNNPASAPTDYVEFSVTGSGGNVAAQPMQFWIPDRNYTQLIREDFLVSGTITAGAAPPFASSITHNLSRGASMLDRGNRARAVVVPLSSAVTQAVADRIADLYLTEHVTAPFSGTLKIVGDGARDPVSSKPLAPYVFLRLAGERIRLSNRLDPDTGHWGRDGRIAGVTYNHNDRSVEIAIDDQRQRFDTILSRYAALVGG